jgi:Histidine kinase
MRKNFWFVHFLLCPILLFGQKKLVCFTANWLTVFFTLFSLLDCATAQSMEIGIDSVYCNSVLYGKKPTSLNLNTKDDDVIFFISGCNPSDSTAFQWIGIDANPVLCRVSALRYTNIKGGEYSFSVGKIKNNEFIPSITLPIKVKHTITEYPLFVPSVVFSLLLIFGSIAYLWLMYNFRQRMKVQGLRNQIASDLHDEVGSTLSSIAVLSKVLRKNLSDKDPSSLPVLDKILLTSKETILNLRDTVWAINPENDSFEKLLEKMRSFAYEMLVNEGIALTYQNNLKEDKLLKISMEQRRNIYLMFKECVHNILKHSAATTVQISISNHEDGFMIELKDDGKGFDSSQNFEGNGMKILQRRAKDCFIDLTIQSEIQKGTFVKMIVPEL